MIVKLMYMKSNGHDSQAVWIAAITESGDLLFFLFENCIFSTSSTSKLFGFKPLL